MAGLQGCFPISELSSYTKGWTIRARVTSKGQLRTFKAKVGESEGKVFHVDLLDCEGGEIRANFFNAAVDSCYETLQVGKCYTFTRGNVRIANRQYNPMSHRYELVFDKDAVIEEVSDDSNIDALKLHICDLRSLQTRSSPCTVDLCGVVVSFKPVTPFVSREGKELVKREISIADDSARKMSVTLWGEAAKKDDKTFEGQPVICFKGVAIKAWDNSITGSLLESGNVLVDPKVPEAARVRQWWLEGGSKQPLSTLFADSGLCDLGTLQGKSLPCIVTLCGIITAFKPQNSFTSKEGKSLVKREILLADQTARTFSVTLWGDRAQKEDKEFDGHPVACIRGVLVKEWGNGRSGSLLEAGEFHLNPSTSEAENVRQWWSHGGSSQTLTALSSEGGAAGSKMPAGQASSLSRVRQVAEQVIADQEVLNIVCRLAIVQTKKQGEDQPLFYMACQEQKDGNKLPCNKRVDSSGFCATCNRAGKIAPRLNLRCKFVDSTDTVWLTTFHEAAQKAVIMDAVDVKALEEGPGGRAALEAAIQRSYFQQPLQVTVKARSDDYQGQQRTNVTCVDARPVPMAEHGRIMLKEISDMLLQEDARASSGGA